MIQQLYDFADNNGGKLPTQTFFILDEFANIGKIPDFDKRFQQVEVEKFHLVLFYKTLIS